MIVFSDFQYVFVKTKLVLTNATDCSTDCIYIKVCFKKNNAVTFFKACNIQIVDVIETNNFFSKISTFWIIRNRLQGTRQFRSRRSRPEHRHRGTFPRLRATRKQRPENSDRASDRVQFRAQRYRPHPTINSC